MIGHVNSEKQTNHLNPNVFTHEKVLAWRTKCPKLTRNKLHYIVVVSILCQQELAYGDISYLHHFFLSILIK